MTRAARILVAAPDPAIVSTEVDDLRAATYTARGCAPAELTRQVDAFRPDLVILHLAPGDRGAIASVVHHRHASYHPLVLCTVGDQRSVTEALDAGADACAVAPLSQEDLGVHVRALLRRAPWLAHSVMQAGGLVIDESSHTTSFDDVPVDLPRKEFGLLVALARDAGTVLSKRTLLERIWGFDRFDENLVEVHISSLRRRLPPRAARMIHTVRGVGYVLRDDGAQGHPG